MECERLKKVRLQRIIDEMQFFKLPLWEVKLKEEKNDRANSKRMEELYVDIYFMYKHKFIKDKVWCFKKNKYIEV